MSKVHVLSLLLGLLFVYSSNCYGQYNLMKVSITYVNKEPKTRGTLFSVSDSAIRLIVKTANPAYRSDQAGKHKAYLTDTLTVPASQISYLRVGLKSDKWRMAHRSSLVMTGIGMISGYIIGSQSEQKVVLPVIEGIAGAILFGGIGLTVGLPLGFLINDFTKKKYIINGDVSTFQKILPKLQGYK